MEKTALEQALIDAAKHGEDNVQKIKIMEVTIA